MGSNEVVLLKQIIKSEAGHFTPPRNGQLQSQVQ